MRQSAKAKHTTIQQQHHTRHKRIALWLFVVLAASLSLLTLSYAHWQATATVKASNTQIIQSQAKAKKYIELSKINMAKKAEAAEKAKLQAQIIAKGEDERAIAAAQQTEPPATPGCDVTNPASIGVVVNKKHCFSPIDWAPNDLTGVNGFLLRSEPAAQLTAMLSDASANNLAIDLTSTYRSYQNQQTVYANWVAVNGSIALADTVSARPGYSEHQTGLAADLQTPGCALECFSGTAAYTWLKQNAAQYGFIERYPAGLSAITGYAPESWHWRYVGVTTAQDMQAKGIQTLEQYFGISGGSY